MIEASLLPIQKCLLYLYLMKKMKRECYFQDVKDHLKRSKSQVSVLLSSLEGSDLILRENKRPQPISIISTYLKILRPKIQEDLDLISQYITAEALEELTSSLTETIELSLHKLFRSLKL